jgi:hypothetical protein
MRASTPATHGEHNGFDSVSCPFVASVNGIQIEIASLIIKERCKELQQEAIWGKGLSFFPVAGSLNGCIR